MGLLTYFVLILSNVHGDFVVSKFEHLKTCQKQATSKSLRCELRVTHDYNAVEGLNRK